VTTTPKALLKRAADIITERGWTQGKYVSKDGCVCALGSVRLAAAEAAHIVADIEEDPQDYFMRTRLPDDIRKAWNAAETTLEGLSPYCNVVLWNDEAGRSAEEVQSLLRRAAAEGAE